MTDYVIAIDPGTTESGVCIARTEDCKPLFVTKVDNKSLVHVVREYMSPRVIAPHGCQLVIERMQGNSMPVSSDVFLTCEWIGRFDVIFNRILDNPTNYVFRRDEYRTLCGNIYSRNDKGIKQALVERFAYGQSNYGKGTAKSPGWFYGFANDMWSAYAIAVTFIDMCKE